MNCHLTEEFEWRTSKLSAGVVCFRLLICTILQLNSRTRSDLLQTLKLDKNCPIACVGTLRGVFCCCCFGRVCGPCKALLISRSYASINTLKFMPVACHLVKGLSAYVHY